MSYNMSKSEYMDQGPPPYGVDTQPTTHFQQPNYQASGGGHNYSAAPEAFNATPTVQVVVPSKPNLSGESVRVACPYCRNVVTTIVTYENGILTYIAAGFLCLICICCAVIPCVMDGCKDARHDCPSCGRCLGVYKRI